MGSFSEGMSDRLMVFAVNIIMLEKQLCKTYSGRHIYGQLFRAGTSGGANYEEAQGGESRADFIRKLQVVLKELRETQFWIKLIAASKLVSPEDKILLFLLTESKELTCIAAKSVVTAKSKLQKKHPPKEPLN